MGYTAIACGDFVEKAIHNKHMHGKAAIERRLGGDSAASKPSTIKFGCNTKAAGPIRGQQEQRKEQGREAKRPGAKGRSVLFLVITRFSSVVSSRETDPL